MKGDINTLEIQKQFLEGCSKHIKADLELHHPYVLSVFKSSQKDRSYHLWKRYAKSIELYSNDIFKQKFNFHYNPVKAGLCNLPEEYLYSSSRYYETGIEFREGILTHYRG